MKHGFRILFFLASLSAIQAQQNLSLRDATLGQRDKFRTDAMYFGSWRNGSQFTIVHRDTLFAIEPDGKKSVLATAADFRNKTGLPIQRVPYITWINQDLFRISVQDKRYLISASETMEWPCAGCPIQGLKPGQTEFDQNAENELFSEASGHIAYTVGNNVYIYPYDGNGAYGVTHDTKPGIVNGSPFVHRQEFGIHEGMWFSRDGQKLAFYRKDESNVDEYPLVETGHQMAKHSPIRYPMAGQSNESVTIGIHNVPENKTVFIDEGPIEGKYLTAVTWNLGGDEIYTASLNRGQDSLELLVFSAENGKFKRRLFFETAKTWVEPEHPLTFLPNTPNHFIWQSERDGYNHLYLYDENGKLIRQLTKGEFEVTEILGVHPSGTHLLIQTTRSSPLDRNIEWLEIKSGKWNRLDPEDGTWDASLSPDGKKIWISGQSAKAPFAAWIMEIGKKPVQVYRAPDPFRTAGLELPEAQIIELTAADGKTKLYGRLIVDERVNPGTRKPVLLYVYGGPHAQMVTNTWLKGARLWDYYMAMKGYVVITVDNRGSAHRGHAFESVIHRQLGQAEMADQMKAVEYVRSLPYVDASRIGVHGWSFGGFMTMSLLLNHPDIFTCGVAGGPVTNWEWYEIMYGERYMDHPEENPEGYALTRLTDKAGNLQKPLLIIHGAQDDVVVPQHALEFIEACIKKNKPVDFFLYPSHKHNVIGADRLHLMEKITEYLDRHLLFGSK